MTATSIAINHEDNVFYVIWNDICFDYNNYTDGLTIFFHGIECPNQPCKQTKKAWIFYRQLY